VAAILSGGFKGVVQLLFVVFRLFLGPSSTAETRQGFNPLILTLLSRHINTNIWGGWIKVDRRVFPNIGDTEYRHKTLKNCLSIDRVLP